MAQKPQASPVVRNAAAASPPETEESPPETVEETVEEVTETEPEAEEPADSEDE